MLRKILFAIVPMVLAISTVNADETIDLNLSSITDAAVEIVEPGLGDVDVDALAGQASGNVADGKGSDEAIEASFRRFGYRHRGYGYGYGRSYGYGYRSYRPFYSYRYSYPTYYSYRPVHYYSYPVVTYYSSYWGCY